MIGNLSTSHVHIPITFWNLHKTLSLVYVYVYQEPTFSTDIVMDYTEPVPLLSLYLVLILYYIYLGP
jgi:hypothetical protein